MVTISANDETKKTAKILQWDEIKSQEKQEVIIEMCSPKVRLFVRDTNPKGVTTVRVAHEALFLNWKRAKEILAEALNDIRIRERLSLMALLYHKANKKDKKSLLLNDGLPLNEAVDLLQRRADELDSKVITFVNDSQTKVKRAKNRKRLMVGTILVVSLLVSGVMWKLMDRAEKEKNRVEQVTSKLVQIITLYKNVGIDSFDKDRNKSIKIFESIIDNFEDSKNPEIRKTISLAYLFKGGAYDDKKEYDKAIEAYQKAIEINPKFDLAYYKIANLYYMNLKNLDKARTYYQESLKLDANNSSAFINLYELQIITNQEINQSWEQTYIKTYQDKKEEFIHYKMLKIIKDIAQKREVDITKWQEKYRGVSLGGCSFTELEEWTKTLEDKAIKPKINTTIEVFKKHKEN
jgi:tetratricopeptide (TPR) repeat protein